LKIIPAFIRRRIEDRPNLLKIVDNIGWLFFDKILRMGVGLFVGVWVARYLGPEQFGLLSFALAFIGLFGAIAGLGLQGIVVRDIVRDPDGKEETLGSAAALQFVGGLLAYGLILGTIFWLRPDDALAKMLVAILGSMMLFKASEVAVYWFESQVLSKYTVWVQNGSFLTFAAIKVGLILNSAPLIAFAWAMMAEALMVALLLSVILGLRGPRLRQLRITLARAKTLLKDSWPLLLSGIAITLAMRIDQIMIGQIMSDTAVGFYSVGVRLAEVFVFVGLMVASSVFPRLIKLKEENFEGEFVKFIRLPFYVLFVLAVAVSGTSGFTVPMIFGQEYANSSPVLSVLIFSIPITYISVMSSKYLLRKGMQYEILYRQVVGVFVNIAMNLLLIPVLGIIGAAIATVVTDIVISIGMDLKRKKFQSLLEMKIRALFWVTRTAQ